MHYEMRRTRTAVGFGPPTNLKHLVGRRQFSHRVATILSLHDAMQSDIGCSVGDATKVTGDALELSYRFSILNWTVPLNPEQGVILLCPALSGSPEPRTWLPMTLCTERVATAKNTYTGSDRGAGDTIVALATLWMRSPWERSSRRRDRA